MLSITFFLSFDIFPDTNNAPERKSLYRVNFYNLKNLNVKTDLAVVLLFFSKSIVYL